MTKEEFLKLSVKEQKSLVNDMLNERGWKVVETEEYGTDWHQRIIIINTGGDEWRDWCLRTVTPLSLVTGVGFLERE
ncbi:hypothetical protein [Escherichia coli]|uniref:hypothetical protein n=1 Tax=Escherichia coli TaxID=562 RepID=UPI00157A9FBD|nr:hypothetical protein [Escherichia coli]